MKAEALTRLLQPLVTRVANILTRSRVVSVDSTQPIYVVLSTVRGKPAPEQIPMMQHFGFASVPPKDSDQLRVHLSSDPDNPLILASLDTNSQPTDLESGDSALFDDRGQFIKIQVDGIHIFSPDQDINITTSGANVNISTDEQVNIAAADSVNIDSAVTNLGVGGEPIARLGDKIEVIVPFISPTVKHEGEITSAGTNTST